MAKSGEISGDISADNIYLMNHAEHIAMICQSGKVFKFSQNRCKLPSTSSCKKILKHTTSI